VVDVDAQKLLDGLDLQLRPAEGVGRVDFLRLVAGNLGEAVPGDGELAEVASARAYQHQRVGPELAL
jgi:hypothetical protein